jgi:MFS family permease
MSWGTCIGWSSPAIAKMTKDLNDSPLDFIPTDEEFSWIGSILPFGGLIGPLICSPLPTRIGRKNCLILTALFFIASFLILMFTNNLPSIYAARFLQGVGSGLVMVILPMYIGEISSPECRGILSSFIQIGLVGK